MQPPLAARLELEVLHRVRDVGARAIYARLLQRLVEQLAGRPEEGLSDKVFLIAGLFANEHEVGVRRPLAEHGLRRVLPQGAAMAAHRVRTHSGERVMSRAGALGGLACCRLLHPVENDLRPARFRRRLGGDHLHLALRGLAHQRGDERALGQVLPVAHRHLALHRAHLEPGGIEDAGVIRAPVVLDRIAARRVGLRAPRDQSATRACPSGRSRSGVRIDQRMDGEAAREERRGQFDDVMLGLEPRDEQRALLVRSISRKRTNASILWRSRRIVLAIARARNTSSSVVRDSRS